MFDKTFYHFFFGFVAIIFVAFTILLVAGYKDKQNSPSPVDNLAQPQ